MFELSKSIQALRRKELVLTPRQRGNSAADRSPNDPESLPARKKLTRIVSREVKISKEVTG